MVDQHTLESKLQPDAVIYLSPQITPEEAFGPMEKWILTIGSYRLMLNPLNGYWVYEDTLHDSWEATGFRAGEVLFYLEGEELAVKLNPDPAAWEKDNRYRLAEEFYRRLQKQLSAGSIDHQTFSKAVEALRFKDRNGSWWQVREADGNWLTWNGSAWVESNPDKSAQDSAAAVSRRKFAALKEDFFSLWQQRDEGQVAPEDFANRVNDLRLQDEAGNWWQIRDTDGAWLKWSGTAWVEAQLRF